MTKKLGSKLASSVRQAKAKQPQENTLKIKSASKTSKPINSIIQNNAPPALISSRRVWPD